MTVSWTLGVVFLILGLFSGIRPWQVGCAFLLAIVVMVSLFPRSIAAKALFSRHGPSLQVEGMTRSECWRSAGGFLIIAASAVATVYGIMLLEPWLGRDPLDIPVVMALVFMYSLFILMGVAGALYLGIRAPFRPEILPSNSPNDVGV